MLKPANVTRYIPPSLLLHGLPREELQVFTPTGLTVWYPSGEVRAPRPTASGWHDPAETVLFIDLTER